MTTLTSTRPNLRQKALEALDQLPPFSPSLNRLLASLAKEDVFFGEIASIIEKDTVLAGHVLKLVNSALYARSGTINSVRHAVSILGLNKLRNVALSLSVSRMWKKVQTPRAWSQAAFNQHSVATAVMSDSLAQMLSAQYPEGAFTAGLLHAVGKLMIAVGLPQQYGEILSVYTQSQMPMEEIEREAIGCTHADLAQEALLHWKLPVEIQDAVGRQIEPRMTPGSKMDLSCLLKTSHDVVNRLDVMIPSCACAVEGTPEDLLKAAGLGSRAAKILEEFKTELNAMRGFF
ncbi:MAG: HDOD domain-containing protein [Acidobacteria bacterium]|nr:HDOD domain-containing protein [Acidobacteriota bacterium]